MLPEIQIYLDTLRELRANTLKTLDGLDAAGLNWAPTNDRTNSLFILGTHCIGSEHGWIFETLHQGPKTRDRASEFMAKSDGVGALRQQFEQVGRETEEILGALAETDLGTTYESARDGTVTTRWILMHVVRHYSEHIGQMYLTRQLFEKR